LAQNEEFLLRLLQGAQLSVVCWRQSTTKHETEGQIIWWWISRTTRS